MKNTEPRKMLRVNLGQITQSINLTSKSNRVSAGRTFHQTPHNTPRASMFVTDGLDLIGTRQWTYAVPGVFNG